MIVVTMGVTGCGKTTVGQLLAEELKWSFFDADKFHPEENVQKMRQGISLDDQDREPWLMRLNSVLHKQSSENKNTVLACSALKKIYRDKISANLKDIRFVFLNGDYQLINKRLQARTGHYMNPALLQSQFDTLELPNEEENVIQLNVGVSPQILVDEIKVLIRRS